MNSLGTWMLISVLVLSGGASLDAAAQARRNPATYNPEEGVALRGYDPVSYFQEGGGRAAKGTIRLEYGGVLYLFATQRNVEVFMSNPEKFEPTYGRWCAFAMASGSYVDIKPELYTIHGERIHFFVSSRAKRNFDADLQGFEANADAHWERLSGEKPRP